MGWASQNPSKAKALLIASLLLVFWILLLFLELLMGYSSFKAQLSTASDSDQRYIRLRENPPDLHVTEEISEEAHNRIDFSK